jgi:hypothetical protein
VIFVSVADPGGDLGDDCLLVGDSTIETLGAEDAELGFGQVQLFASISGIWGGGPPGAPRQYPQPRADVLERFYSIGDLNAPSDGGSCPSDRAARLAFGPCICR